MSMIVPASVSPMMAALGGDPLDEIYRIGRSLRFNSADSAYLNRTPAGAGSLTTWTWSGWIKRSKISATMRLLGATTSGTNYTSVALDNDFIDWVDRPTGGVQGRLTTAQVLRDVGAEYNLIFVWDTTNATAADRIRIYLNGARITSFTTNTNPSLNATSRWNDARPHYIGQDALGAFYFDGLLSEVNFIDGQALDPSAFGQFHPVTGQWRPKRYTGTYGTNGFYLDFSDNSNTTAATLGADRSGNGNNWTPNNFSVTAGQGNDSLIDTPTTEFAVLNNTGIQGSNPSNFTFSDGNLNGYHSGVNTGGSDHCTLSPNSGKWYCETTITTAGRIAFGVAKPDYSNWDSSNYRPPFHQTSVIWGGGLGGFFYFQNASNIGGSDTYTNGDTIMVAWDCDTGKVWFGKNGTWNGSGNPAAGTGQQGTTTAGELCFIWGNSSSALSMQATFNFGQQSQSGGAYYSAAGGYFRYAPPTGYKALSKKNLPLTTGAALEPRKNMDVAIYTGNGAARSISVDGIGNNLVIAPDLVWIKGRSGATSHKLTDIARGVTKALSSDSTAAESTDANGLTAFNSNGFSLGTDSNYNTNTATYVAWLWKAGGAPVTNNAGSISSQVSANVAAGISVVTYTGTGANATVGHGLGVAPKMVIVKERVAVSNWSVYHEKQNASPASGRTQLNLTDAFVVSSVIWNNTSPTSSVFSVGTGLSVSGNGFVAYCFAEIAGFSKFGSYVGNGSADGTFVHCGLRPRWILIKRIDAAANWLIYDSARDTYNVASKELIANLSNAEFSSSDTYIDFLSNGFKLRTTGGANPDWNVNGGTYVFAAFSEFPFRYSNGR